MLSIISLFKHINRRISLYEHTHIYTLTHTQSLGSVSNKSGDEGQKKDLIMEENQKPNVLLRRKNTTLKIQKE